MNAASAKATAACASSQPRRGTRHHRSGQHQPRRQRQPDPFHLTAHESGQRAEDSRGERE